MGYAYTGLIANPTVFLPWLTSQLKARGVTFLQRTLTSLSELRNLTNAELLVNATGLGAKELVGDGNVYGVRGQTIFVPCAKKDILEQATLHQGSHYTYAIPRPSDGGIILGGVSQRANTSIDPDLGLRPDILKRVNRMTDGRFDWVDLENPGRDIVGFRPAREGGLRCVREGDVVHAYGVGGLGYVYAFGIAERVVDLVEDDRARL
jgi:glycine/D-amino acid oxidase-like deaminating enzyme